MAADSQIVVDRLAHVLRPSRQREVVALENASLTAGRSEFAAPLSPVGCGKSTLLYMCMQNKQFAKKVDGLWKLTRSEAVLAQRVRAS